MFEPTKAPDLLLAFEMDGQRRLCATVLHRVSREVIATAVDGRVVLHVPKTAVMATDIALALEAYDQRLKYEGKAA